MTWRSLFRDNAVDATDVPKLIASVEPDSEQYRKTEEALARVYRAGEAAGGVASVGAVADGGEAGGGGRELSGGGLLVTRLQLEGDLRGGCGSRRRTVV